MECLECDFVLYHPHPQLPALAETALGAAQSSYLKNKKTLSTTFAGATVPESSRLSSLVTGSPLLWG